MAPDSIAQEPTVHNTNQPANQNSRNVILTPSQSHMGASDTNS